MTDNTTEIFYKSAIYCSVKDTETKHCIMLCDPSSNLLQYAGQQSGIMVDEHSMDEQQLQLIRSFQSAGVARATVSGDPSNPKTWSLVELNISIN